MDACQQSCQDVDECAEQTDDCDDDPNACVNTPGSFMCTCPEGYADPNGRDCQDIDECVLGTDTCDDSPAATCQNTTGAFTCRCPVGYTDVNGDGSACHLEIDCMENTDLCDVDPAAACQQVMGEYRCVCPGGFWDALGDGSRCEPHSRRLAVGTLHSCVILDGGGVRCWGENSSGQLGRGVGFSDPSVTPRELSNIELGARAVAISAGCVHNCAVLEDGSVKCWGSNTYGQLGLDDTNARGDNPNEMGEYLPAVDLGGPAIEVGLGCEYSCALLLDGSVKCWGSGKYGQHAQGDDEPRGDGLHMGQPAIEMPDLQPVDLEGPAVALSPGYRFVCARLSDQRLKCWARNANGYLGLGNDEHRGDDPNEMGSMLPGVDLGTGRHAVQHSAGIVHSCALLDNGEVKCWGLNTWGYLDQENDISLGDQADEMGDFLHPVALGGPARSLVAGDHTCATLTTGVTKCWGHNQTAQLGAGDTVVSRGGAPGDMAMLMPLDLGTGRSVLWMAADEFHSCALLDNGEVKCWGLNSFGQLGTGTGGGNLGDAANEMGDDLPAAIELW